MDDKSIGQTWYHKYCPLILVHCNGTLDDNINNFLIKWIKTSKWKYLNKCYRTRYYHDIQGIRDIQERNIRTYPQLHWIYRDIWQYHHHMKCPLIRLHCNCKLFFTKGKNISCQSLNHSHKINTRVWEFLQHMLTIHF